MTKVNDRLDRTRAFFKFDSWSIDAADAWQHITTGACDNDDLNGDKSFTALDMDNMFNEYRAFGRACNDSFHHVIDNVDELMHLAGFVYIACDNGAVEFMNADDEYQHERAEWLFKCAEDGAGVLLRAVVDSIGAICIELA